MLKRYTLSIDFLNETLQEHAFERVDFVVEPANIQSVEVSWIFFLSPMNNPIEWSFLTMKLRY